MTRLQHQMMLETTWALFLLDDVGAFRLSCPRAYKSCSCSKATDTSRACEDAGGQGSFLE